MLKNLLRYIYWWFLLGACATATNIPIRTQHTVSAVNTPVITSNQFDTSLLTGKKPVSLLDLPVSEEGNIILSDGYYEADFKSYCLQPGTPDPSDRDAYLQGPLTAYRKDIIETVLRHSLKKTNLEQRNIQLLLWSIVSGSNYNKLSWQVQSTAQELLSSKQIFKLKGGVMGMVKTVSSYIPATGSAGAFNEMKQLFELGTSSYDAFEKVAVLHQPSEIKHPGYKKDQWYKQDDGYYLRYFPSGYQQVKIQVYVPQGMVDTTSSKAGNYLLFDPVTMMAIPANSNSQKLGIGAPAIDIIRKIIQINKDPGNIKKLPPTTKDPKTRT